MQIGSQAFPLGERTFIMGILNVTPDSFSDGGRFDRLDTALAHAEQMLAEGADILDVGGESTRPGHTQISDKEEIARIRPVIEALRSTYPQTVISVDSYKPAVCRAALLAGADLINDIWGFRYDSAMAPLAAEFGAPCCLMHNRPAPVADEVFPQTYLAELSESLRLAEAAGVPREKIILYPGVGFGKTYEQNLWVLRHLSLLKEVFGLPVLLGISRKSVIGLTLNTPVDDRLEGSLALNVLGIAQGADFVRVHDVRATCLAAKMTDKVLREGEHGCSFR